MNRCLQEAKVPDWMTKGKTTLIQKDPSKGNVPNNYRPITCLPLMWKILTAQIREEIYFSLTSHRLFPEEQKGCRKGSRGTAELLYIDQHILNEDINFLEKTRKTKIQRLIFQGDALSLLLFVITKMPLNHILRKYSAGYKLSRSQEKINHLMYMDDIKLFAKNEKELETLLHAIRI